MARGSSAKCESERTAAKTGTRRMRHIRMTTGYRRTALLTNSLTKSNLRGGESERNGLIQRSG